MDTIEETLQKTLETLSSTKALRTTAQPFDEKRKRTWLDRWLKLEARHPKLIELEGVVFEFCRDYAKRPGKGRRLLITGENGSGKTHTAKAISRWASRLAIDLPWMMGDMGPRLARSEFINWPMHIRSLYGHFDRKVTDDDVDLLVVDDVGAEHDPSKFAAGELYLVLEQREYNWLVMTSNIPWDNWRDRFDQRTASRLMRNFTLVSLDGVPDFKSL